MKKVSKKSVNDKLSMTTVLNSILILICFAGIYTSFAMNSVNRSLWLDEAMLAIDFTQRSLGNLTDGVFSWNQTAPVGWLYIVKILAVLFGHTEYVYRFFSIISYIGILCLVFYLAKRVFGMKYPLVPCAFIASMTCMLRYSNEFKPYISDALFVLFTLLFFYLYEQKKINYIILSVAWAFLIWFSNPVCFIAGGLILSQIGFSVKDKNKKKVKEIVIAGISIVVSFIGNYFYWLRDVAQGSAMQDYWEGERFPLIPTSAEDIELAEKLIDSIYAEFGDFRGLFLMMTITALFFAVKKRDKYTLGFYLGILLSLFASSISMFPISVRLWLFFYPLLTIIVFHAMEEIILSKEKFGQIIFAVCCLCLVFSNNGIRHFSNEENVYRASNETNQQIEYLNKVATPEESIYVCFNATPGVWFKNGYGKSFLNDTNSPIIFGAYLWVDSSCIKDAEKIRNAKKCYIMKSLTQEADVKKLISLLKMNGYVELLYNDYDTPIYYYCENIEDSKTSAELEFVWEGSRVEGACEQVVRIHNTGESYLNHKYEEMQLVDEENKLVAAIPENIAPGETVEVNIGYPEGVDAEFTLKSTYREIASFK